MSQAMTLEPSPVDLDRTMAPSEHNGLGAAYDHYRFEDAPSPSQTSDTLDASSGPPARATAVNHPPEQFVHPLSHGQPVHTSSRPESVSSAVLPPPPPRASTPLHSPRSTRSQSLAASLGSQSPIRRKPLSPTASPLAVRFSSKSYHMKSGDLPEEPDSGYYSLDSPDLYDLGPTEGPAPVASLPTPLEPLSEEEFQGKWPQPPTGPITPAALEVRNIPDVSPAPSQTDDLIQPKHPTSASDVTSASQGPDQPNAEPPNSNHRSTGGSMSLFARTPMPPQLDLDYSNSDSQPHTLSPTIDRPPDSASSHASHASLNKPLPKSPPRSPASASKLSNFFGWGAAQSPSNTDHSNKDYSPIPSPVSPKRHAFSDESPVSTRDPNSTKAQALESNALGYVEAYFPTPPNSYTLVSPVVEIEEMEDELKAISAELASSIRREMDLEDLVDRLQSEIANPSAPGKRTSDYFSDSGYSTAKSGDFENPKDEISSIQRKAEQEKAQLRLELTTKLQEERGRRNALDQQIKELAEKASQADAAQMTSKDADARVRELEKSCEDLRRRLSEEREVKNNFEDLLTALKGELQNAALERDNLRDEVVPQLRARVEGLEAQQTENEKLAYETTKLQQELQDIKDSKAKHDTLARLRSSSVTGQSFKLSRPPSGLHSGGLARSNTVKGGHVESRDVLSERLKDVEAQRDALHNALKNLLDRQDFQNKENEKKIKLLEVERDRLLSASPRKAGFDREVSTLREEVNTLRRRAEEAIEQKWQVEKGLIGLKSDLDRAEEEITSLRALLNEKDILIPDSFSRYSSNSATGAPGLPATSASLEKAYADLQKSYKDALERIKDLEIGGTSASQDERTRLAMERLEQSLSSAIHDRDDARQESAALQNQVERLQQSEKDHLEGERDLADQLRDSANRVEELTQQVRAQLAINANLRSRLSETVARGEAGQKANKERLASMQIRMRNLEEQVVAAQTAAEERVNRHEEELGKLRESTSANLHRLHDSNSGLRSPRLFPPKSPMSPLLSPNSGGRFPRMLSSHSRKSSRNRPSSSGTDEEDTSQVETLKARVAELEKSLVTADFEMQEVVGRMNTAQIEVMTLQEERETAARETKKLQKLLEAEKVNAFQQRFNTITN
ncbi:hypothetical protein N8I77_004555 [Diaporthe amygdali]|uniref:DUF7603 domain-containing protein n=1 Tax=Phomopsis amygdali TaxID=1214568 RepID=A0AAD9SL49_PHOAM|nr:hypothetical protein N8I77_004555 [Diaporthe amygdali]